MSELRRNPITGQWVIIAENRDQRPQEVVIQQAVQEHFDCPFCEGREQRTPGETLARRAAGSKPDGPGWRVRVVPNLYPAVDGSPHPDALSRGEGEFIGLHEVIIESPGHLVSVTQLDEEQFAEVLGVYRERLEMLRREGVFRNATLFKNSGILGGATLSHLHSQLIVTNSPAGMLTSRETHFRAFAQQHGLCPACRMLGEAAGDGRLLVAQTEHFAAICPHASRLPYEVWILPRQHTPHYDQIAPESLPELAGLFRRLLVKLEAILKGPAYNYIVHTVGFDTSDAEHYHWHIEILPRTTTLAGFELGTGCYINTVSPERAAQVLRTA